MKLLGNPLDYILVFWYGVLVSFSPCVYPLIPISVGYIGIKAGTSKWQGLILSLTYVTGLAITYAILGIIASLTGRIFGEISSHPLTYMILGTLIIIFGISMFDIFHFRIPNLVKSPVRKKQSYFFAFVLGLSSGLVIGPCTTPILGAILAYLATQKRIVYGATLLFVYAYGMGLILILAGTFSAFLLSLPKLGNRMLYLKRFAGMLLVLAGVYFIILGIKRL